MARIERRTKLADHEIDAVSALLDAAARTDDYEAVDPHGWAERAGGGGEGFTAFIAWPDDDAEPKGDHGAPPKGDDAGAPDDDAVPKADRAGPDGDAAPVGYAQVLKEGDGWQLAYAVHPDHRRPDASLEAELIAAGAAVAAGEGGGRLRLWVDRPGPAADRLAATIGLTPQRTLYQMRRRLPVQAGDGELATRSFVPGEDEAAWLEVNNRAFRWHPEQGGWDLATLAAREAEPWFDPDGFLLYESEGRLVGFCWTKVHAEHDPPLGEIYVIAVDPDAGRRGIGRRLVLAGLAHLARAGLQVGMLYTEADNAPAVKLYVDLGFVVDHIDRLYAGDIKPAG